MNSFQDGRGWAEMYVCKRQTTPPGTPWRDIKWSYQTPDHIKLFSSQWKAETRIPRGGDMGFFVRSHGKGQYDTGGHNWYMTTRFDVWFLNPQDGWGWFGWLVTGGCNCTFRVRRLLSSPLLIPFDKFGGVRSDPAFKHRFHRPLIEPVEADCFRIADGKHTKWFARQFDSRWHFGVTLGDLFASRLLQEAA